MARPRAVCCAVASARSPNEDGVVVSEADWAVSLLSAVYPPCFRRDPADPLPRPPPPPKAHKQIFSDGWWGPSPKGRPMRAAQAPAAPTPRAPTHFFEGSRGAIHRPDPAQLARLAASAAAERPGACRSRAGGGGCPCGRDGSGALPQIAWN